MIKRLMRMAAAALGLLLTVGTGTALASGEQDSAIDNHSVHAAEVSQHLRMVDGETFVPVKELANLMGWELEYEPESGRITVRNDLDDTLSFEAGSKTLTFNGSSYVTGSAADVVDGDTYFPLRLLAESMNASVAWDAEAKVAAVREEPAYVVEEGDTLWGIAEAHETTPRELMLRNGMTDIALAIGQSLKLVVPEFLEPGAQVEAKAEAKADAAASKAEAKVDPEDLALLAKLVQVEAGYEPYEGKLAVANVVVNRVKAGFSATVKGVIYAPGQFPPAKNGLLAKAKASEDCIKAAKAALSGENNVPDAVYFFNPTREPDKAKKLTKVKQIGHHMFAK